MDTNACFGEAVATACANNSMRVSRSGHWSRDCTAPPSEWVKRAFPADGTPAHAGENTPGAAKCVTPLWSLDLLAQLAQA